MEYDITNAMIQPVPEKYWTNSNDHPFQLSFRDNTVVDHVLGSTPYTGPAFMPIANIPRTVMTGQQFGNSQLS